VKWPISLQRGCVPVHLTPEIGEPFATIARCLFDLAGLPMRDYLIEQLQRPLVH
jgi:hypothetical protein